ncbi:hypothetical protein [Nocardiopsis synnemataformans]|uniref:hypothetical protein n=1 Tax=Nocardiopsis synnemataformans TaxID=61305 RepID=UPI003EBDE1FE
MDNMLQRYVERARSESDIDPRTEVEAHADDPEQIIAAWERDRALLVAKLDSVRGAADRYRTDRDNAWWELENR